MYLSNKIFPKILVKVKFAIAYGISTTCAYPLLMWFLRHKVLGKKNEEPADSSVQTCRNNVVVTAQKKLDGNGNTGMQNECRNFGLVGTKKKKNFRVIFLKYM
uniref:Transmembrane protein n=1 Tax=Glossina brevipalpis TaxID=37001 RepID=A0A1A9WLN2_9MUSC